MYICMYICMYINIPDTPPCMLGTGWPVLEFQILYASTAFLPDACMLALAIASVLSLLALLVQTYTY